MLSLILAPAVNCSAAVNYYPAEYNGEPYHGLLPICNEGEIDPETGDYKNPCGIESLMAMVNKIINFVTLQLVAPLFAVILTYAGVLYLSTGISDKKSQAKKIIINSLKGFALVLASWVIIKTILDVFGYHGPMFL